MKPHPRAAAAAALCLTTAALSLALGGPALASGTPPLVPGHVHTAGRPAPGTIPVRPAAGTRQNADAASATLTESPSSVPNGATLTFAYSVPAAATASWPARSRSR